MLRAIAASLLLVQAGSAAAAAPTDPAPHAAPAAEAPAARLQAIEQRTGGRLGVALLDHNGALLLGHRETERFAMCSTFKHLLAGMVLDGIAQRRWGAQDRLPMARADILPNSPVSEQHVRRGSIDMRSAAEAIVTVSDNSAANALLRATGGPAVLTRWLNRAGDPVTRLDRTEMALNENRSGDLRDTTSPLAMAGTTHRLAVGTELRPDGRRQLRAWMAASRTGLQRIRAGLPAGWQAGDKSGTCGNAYNDVAWFRGPDGRDYTLAVYLDRPSVGAQPAQAAIAEVARTAAASLTSGPGHYAPQAAPVH